MSEPKAIYEARSELLEAAALDDAREALRLFEALGGYARGLMATVTRPGADARAKARAQAEARDLRLRAEALAVGIDGGAGG